MQEGDLLGFTFLAAGWTRVRSQRCKDCHEGRDQQVSTGLVLLGARALLSPDANAQRRVLSGCGVACSHGGGMACLLAAHAVS